MEVLGFPKVESNNKNPKAGENIELICQIKHLPIRYELHWIFNDKKLEANVINKQLKAESTESRGKAKRNTDVIDYNKKHNTILGSYTIINEKVQNVTISKLKIKNLDEYHKGTYKCKYDKVESKFNLDFKSITIFFFFSFKFIN